METKPSLQAYLLADIAVKEELDGDQANSSVKDAWINLGNQLEIEGISKDKIGTVMTKLILEKKSAKTKIPQEELRMSGYFHKVVHSQNWFDPFYSHPTDDALERREDTSYIPTKYEIENQDWIDAINEFKEFLDTEKLYLKKHHFVSKIPIAESNECVGQIRSIIKQASERLNNKTKISPSNYAILIRNTYTASGTLLSQLFYEHVKEKEVFVKKQYQKVVKAIMQDMPAEFEPNDDIQSKACGFSGVPCPNCDCFRTEYVPAVKVIEEKDWNGKILRNENGDPVKKTIGIRKIHCYAEDRDHEAPMPQIPAAEINTSNW